MGDHADTAAQLREVAERLQAAAQHALTAARHMDEAVVPRACAHVWAARGHMLSAQAQLDAFARLHAEKARP